MRFSRNIEPETMRTRRERTENFVRAALNSRKRVAESGVFDLKSSESGYLIEVCKPWCPCPTLVSVYARLGLHRYNLFKKTNFQLIRVRKYVMTTYSALSAYYITSNAMDPTTCSHQTIQTCVAERGYGGFVLTSNIAKLRGEATVIRPYSAAHNGLYCKLGSSMPEWPPLNPFQNRDRFDVVKKSELQDKDHWIRLYLELAVATTDREGEDRGYDLSKLEIVEVALETMEVVYEEPNADNVTVIYIRYKDFCKARVGKDVDRVAIIRRRINEVTGWFSLEGENHSSKIVIQVQNQNSEIVIQGQNQSSEIVIQGQNQSSETVIPRKGKNKSRKLLFSQRLGIHKPWRLSYPRVCKAYKRLGGGGWARRLHKTTSI